MLTLEQIAIIGYLLGPVLRTFYDYFLKVMEDPDIAFNKRYLITMVASMGVAVISAIFYLPGLLQNLPEGSTLYVFLAALSQSFTLNHLINRPLEARFKEAEDTE